MTDHIAKANHVIDWEGAKEVDRKSNQRLRQVKEAVRVSQSPYVMNRDISICHELVPGGIQLEQHLQVLQVYH